MPKKIRLSAFSLFIAFAFILQTAVFATPEIIVTGDGTAMLKGSTSVAPGKPVTIFVRQKDGTPGGYFNDTIIQRDGLYNLMFSLAGYDITKYECFVNVAGQEKYTLPLAEGTLITLNVISFDRDTEEVIISGELWNTADFGEDFKLQIGTFVKTVTATADGKFSFEFNFADTGLPYGKYDFTVFKASSVMNKIDGNIHLLSATGVLPIVAAAAENMASLKTALTNLDNLDALGFDKSVTFGDITLDNAPDGFFENLAQIGVKTDSVENLTLSVKRAYALYLMETNPSDENIQRCANVLGLEGGEYKSIYEGAFFATKKDAISPYLKGKDFTTVEMLVNSFNEAVLLAGINTSEVWSELKSFAESNYQKFGINSSASTAVWQEMILSGPFSSVTAFKEKYNEVCSNISAGGSSDGSSGSSGGGGGSSQSNGAFVLGSTVGNGTTGTANNTVANKPSSSSSAVFSDVSNDHWASGYITYLYERGIISGKGDGTFAPNDLVNRAEVAKLLCASANLTPDTALEGHFADVDKTHWAYGYIETAFKDGLLSGKGDASFGISDFTTREQMAVFCYRLLTLLNPDYVALKSDQNTNFSDSDDISEYAMDAVSAMVELEILKGKGDNKFYPKDYCTRAEAARIFFGVLTYGK